MRIPIGLCLLLASLPVFAESQAELAFRNAQQWTVYIKGSLEEAFLEDEQGSWFGAGIVVDPQRGWVLTNAHVASRSYARLSVSFIDGKPISVTRLFVDPYLDLAVLAYDPEALSRAPTAPPLECKTLPAVGHPVGAFGHPWGFRFTGTRGITSSVTSRLGPDMIQTDAPINGGNSGGPLISLETGSVIGVNAAKISDEEAEGLGFAVPMPMACRILSLMREGRDPSPPDMLVDFAVDDGDERTLVVAKTFLPDGSLALKPGDEVITAFGRPVRTQTELIDELRGHLQSVTLQVRRDGVVRQLSGPWPSSAIVTERSGLMLAGALFAPATRLSRSLGADEPTLMIHDVTSGSEAQSIGLEAFDLLVSVNGQPAASLDNLKTMAESSGQPLELLLLRIVDHGEFFVYQRRYLSGDAMHVVGPALSNATVAESRLPEIPPDSPR